MSHSTFILALHLAGLRMRAFHWSYAGQSISEVVSGPAHSGLCAARWLRVQLVWIYRFIVFATLLTIGCDMYNARIAGCPGSLNSTHDFNSCACRFALTIGAPCGTLLARVCHSTRLATVCGVGATQDTYQYRCLRLVATLLVFCSAPLSSRLQRRHCHSTKSLAVEDSAGWQMSVLPLFPSAPCVSNQSVHVHSC